MACEKVDVIHVGMDAEQANEGFERIPKEEKAVKKSPRQSVNEKKAERRAG